jgi:hypothetical protein
MKTEKERQLTKKEEGEKRKENKNERGEGRRKECA